METILVTGGTGFIGSHTVLDLITNHYNVIIVDNFSNSSHNVSKILNTLAGRNIKLYNVDLRETDELEEIFKKNTIDAVINFAGFKAVGESVSDPLKYYNNNLISMISLLEVMKKYLVKKLVFSSSATVYGIPESMPLKENAPTGVSNPYARTKLIIENILEDLYASDNQWKIISLRYFNPLGAHKSGDLGESPNGIPNNLAPYITQVAVGKLEKLHVFGSDYPTKDGTCIRDYVHINDLASGHTATLNYMNKQEENGFFEVFNLGSGSGYSVFEIINNFEKAIKKEIPFDIVKRRSGDIPVSYADISKAKEKLKWSVTKDINDMCEDSWRWQSKHPNGFDA